MSTDSARVTAPEVIPPVVYVPCSAVAEDEVTVDVREAETVSGCCWSTPRWTG